MTWWGIPPKEELARPLLPRLREELLGRPFLEDHAGVEEADLVRDLTGEAHLVGGDDHRHPDVCEPADERKDFADQLWVERACDLVEEQEVRIHRERPGDRDPLLLSAGEPVGVLIGLVRQADLGEQLARPSARPLLPEAAGVDRRKRHVVENGHVREEVVGLEDDADAPPERVQVDLPVRNRLSVDDDRSLIDALEQVDAAEEGRLAGAGRADQAHDLVQIDGEVDASEDLEILEPLPDVLERDEVRVRRCHTACARSRRSRSLIRLSVKRASGIVRMTKNTAATVSPA